QEAAELCQTIRMDMARALGFDPGNLAAMVRRRIAGFIPVREGARVLFAAHGTGTLFLTHGYGSGNQAMIAGARDIGAKVVELQHGIISRFHLGYSWPGRPSVAYAPDELWCFGDFWGGTT